MTTNQQRVFPLTELEVESAVNDAGEPFIIVRAKGTMQGEPMVLVGHIDTNTARHQGMTFVEAAEAADQDAALFGFTLETADDGASREDVVARAAAFIQAIRHYRAQRAGEVVEAELEELPDVPVDGLIKVGETYYRAPAVPSPIGWHRHDEDGLFRWFPVDGHGKALLIVENPDPTEVLDAVELTPPSSSGEEAE